MEEHTNEKLVRGIDLQNRLWDNTSVSAQRLFKWWKGGNVNSRTYLLIFFLLALNFYITFPVIFKDVSPSFASAAFLQEIAATFGIVGISKAVFFGILAHVSLVVALVSFYLFVRRIVHRHELTAFFATLVFLLPNPFFHNRPPLVFALMNGDGAHMVAFALIPLVLLSLQLFINQAVGNWMLYSALGATVVALISPFAFFNLVILGFILATSEGFVGDMRLKLLRYGLLMVFSVGLSLFWYYPHVIRNIVSHGSLTTAWNKLWSVFPLAIPMIPVFGTIAFLVFDRRPKLKPIFIGISVFVIYFFLYWASSSIKANGIFIPERYLIEMYFAVSFTVPLFFVLIIEFSYTRIRALLAKKHRGIYFGIISSATFIVSFVGLVLVANVQEARAAIHAQGVIRSSTGGLGNLQRVFNFADMGSDVALLISLLTLYAIIKLAKRFRTAAI